MCGMMVEFKDKFQFFISCSRSIIMRKVLSSKMFEKKTRKMVVGFYEDFYIPRKGIAHTSIDATQ